MLGDIDNAAYKLRQCLRLLSSDSARFNADPVGIAFRVSPNGTTYYWYPEARQAENEALLILARNVRWPAGFNPEWFRERIRKCSLMLKEEHAQKAEALKAYKEFINQLMDEIQTRKQFTVCVGLRGLTADVPFTVGKCRFERLTNERVRAGVIGKPDWVMRQPVLGKWGWKGLVGQTVCFTEVCAVDSRHAEVLALVPIEESLDFLRYVQAKFGRGFGNPVPEIGLEPGDAIDRSVTHVHETATGLPATAGLISSPFVHQQLLQRGSIPESEALSKILCKEEAARNDLEKRIIRALAWIGQASFARSNAVRFVCLTTALEAIVLRPGEMTGITDKFVNRAGKLLDNASGMKESKDAYDLRSACVHGRGVVPNESDTESWCNSVCGVVATLLLKRQFNGLDSADALIKALERD